MQRHDFRAGVTGSRTYDDEQTIRAALDAVAFAAISGRYERLTVLLGAAKEGADALADRWVRDWHVPDLHVTAERHPARWAVEGKGAGMLRNRRMVQAGADLWLAFLDLCRKRDCPQHLQHTSHGATHCAELARDAGMPLKVWHLGQEGVFSLGPSADEAPEVADA